MFDFLITPRILKIPFLGVDAIIIYKVFWCNMTIMKVQEPYSPGDDEFVKVPFYAETDGTKTHFLPRLKRPNGFQIGEKGNEVYVEEYWLALAQLMKMSIPRFRRPNQKKT